MYAPFKLKLALLEVRPKPTPGTWPGRSEPIICAYGSSRDHDIDPFAHTPLVGASRDINSSIWAYKI